MKNKKVIYDDLPTATEEETKLFLEVASEFIESTYLYNSVKGVAKTAIADYIASCNGKQLLRKKVCKS